MSTTAFPCCCQVSPRKMAQVQVDLLSGKVQSIVPHQRLIIKLVILSAARCMISDPADLGSPSVADRLTPENTDGLEIPVARHQALYCALVVAVISVLRFVL